MGDFTELVLKVEVKRDTPEDVRRILDFLFNRKSNDPPTNLPKHPFFSNVRWRQIGVGASYYQVPWSSSKCSEGYIFSRSDLKDYENTIDEFLHWVKDYIEPAVGVCYGWKCSEYQDYPTLIDEEYLSNIKLGGD